MTAPLILLYTSWFRKPFDLATLPPGMRCRWTLDRRLLSQADAVIFHLPDFHEIMDARKYPGQDWVGWSMESAENVPVMRNREFMRHMDLVMSYESGSDVWMPYLPGAKWWEDAQKAPVPAKTESMPVVLFQSSNVDRSGRNAFATELSRHIGIDGYGRFLRNRAFDGADLGRKTKIRTIARYRFCLALENSIAIDYVTEKLFDALLAGSVPIYFGAPNAEEFAPEHSFIDAKRFRDAAELAAYLRHLLENPEEYDRYLAWRSMPLPGYLVERLKRIETPAFLRLESKLPKRLEERGAMATGRATLPFGRTQFLLTRLRRLRRHGRWR
jgi:hypothetical protein